MKKIFFLIICLTFLGLHEAITQVNSSYIYLEGIKTIPFKLMVNKKEIPLLNKGYYLTPIQEDGEYIIDIQFAGDLYQSQTFVLDALQGSAYGFKLAKTADDRFYLLDLVNKGKIIETNSDINVGLTTTDNTIHFTSSKPPVQKMINGEELSKLSKKEFKKKKKELETGVNTSSEAVVNKKSTSKTEYGVVEVIKGNAEETVKKETKASKPLSTKQTVAKSKVVNDCPTKASEIEVKNFAEKLSQKSDDEARMIILKKKIFTGCLSSNQLYRLVEIFDTQYARFNVIKFMKPYIFDTNNLGGLADLFKYDSYQNKLKNLAEE